MNDTNPYQNIGYPVAPVVTPPLVVSSPAPEMQMPPQKKRSSFLPILGVIAGMFLLFGAAGTAYFVSTRVSSRQAIAPTAPESEPRASGEMCDESADTHPVCRGKEVGENICFYNTEMKCYRTNGTKCSALTDESGTACSGSGDDDGDETKPVCVRGGVPACSIPSAGGVHDACPTAPFAYGCGMECCNNDTDYVCCCTGCFPAGTDCTQHECVPTCNDVKDNPLGTEIVGQHYWETTINLRAGTLVPFVRKSTNSYGKIILTKNGVPTEIAIPSGGWVDAQELAHVAVTEGSYTLKVRLDVPSETGYSIGWRNPKPGNICGPSNALCSNDVNITPLISFASERADINGVTLNGASANVQCWADSWQNDTTQDWDFEDFAIVLGYEKVAIIPPIDPPVIPIVIPPVVPACTEMKTFIPQIQTNFSCNSDTDCTLSSQPEGQYCNLELRKCATWQQISPITVLPKRARIGDPIKFSFSANDITSLQVKVNTGGWNYAAFNSETGRYDYIYTVATGGEIKVETRYQ